MVALESMAARHTNGRRAHAAALAAAERSAAWLQDRRRAAWERFEMLGFPTTRLEAWRTTDVAPLAATAFAPAPRAQATTAAVDAIAVAGLAGPRLVFVNGRWVPALSRLEGLPPGVRITTLANALNGGGSGLPGALLETHLARVAGFETESFTALNTALFEDGALIHLSGGSFLGPPIQILFLAVTPPGAGSPFEIHPRVLVVAEAGASAEIVEIHAGDGTTFSNPVTEIVAAENGAIAYTRLQRDSQTAFHVGRVRVRLGRDARFTSRSLAFGAALARTEIEVELGGEGAECALYGLYAAGGRQHTDNRTRVEHARPHCTSTQLYKGVLAGESRGIFNGMVLVAKDAQKTDARQTNRNLLLSDGALADTKPQLEIYADDVRCTHGATIGRLDEAAVFYLRSRGIEAAAARDILTHAFAREVVEGASPPALRAALEEWTAARVAALAVPGEESA